MGNIFLGRIMLCTPPVADRVVKPRDTVPAVTIETRLLGDAMHVVVCQLGPDQCVYTEAGRFLWKTVNVAVSSSVFRPTAGRPTVGTSHGGNAGRLLHRALATASEVGKRVLPSDTVVLQRYTANGEGLVAFAGMVPGVVRPLQLDGAAGWFVEQDAFVAAESTVEFELAFSGARTGRKVADGLVLQHFIGTGSLLVASAGELIDLNPAKYGGSLQVDTGCLVAFEDHLSFSVERVATVEGQGVLAGRGGGESLSLATLEGDGEVLLQSLSLDGMAAAITRRAAREERHAGGNGMFAGGSD